MLLDFIEDLLLFEVIVIVDHQSGVKICSTSRD